jgi:hypothetical protein
VRGEKTTHILVRLPGAGFNPLVVVLEELIYKVECNCKKIQESLEESWGRDGRSTA